MTDSQKLDVILSELGEVKAEQKSMRADIETLKSDMTDVKADIADMKSEMADMRSDITDMQSDIVDVKADVADTKSELTALKLHIENNTDRNISILAENHMTLISKLNEAIKTASNNLILEVSYSGLRSRVERLETDMKILKEKAAMA